jgi:RimJ/RimL family protein N-acetyltransferase
MGWHSTDSVETFHDIVGDFLRSRPVEHTVPLTLVGTLRKRGPHAYGPADPIFGWWRDGAGAVGGTFLQTPPMPLLVTSGPAMAELAALLAGRRLPGVNAPAAEAALFATAWQRQTDTILKPGRQSRLFRLDVLTPPSPYPPGKPRVAGAEDRALLVAWMAAFHAEIGEGANPIEELVDDRISYGGWTLWEVDGEPVSVAGVTRPYAGMVRVSAVFTPPDRRGRGYAGAVTTTVSQAALDSGADDVVLFTDLANRTSNALYQRLGYRPIEDRAVVLFES